MEFIHPSKAYEKVSELAIDHIIANHDNKSSEERMLESLNDFYGDNLSSADEEKETLDAKLYPKFTLEKSMPSEPEEITYITVQDVAEHLQISEQGVRKHIKIGNLKAKQIGKLYRIKESDFREFLAKRGTH